MRKLIVSTFLTLDGVMQAPGGPEEDDSGGFAHGGWSVNYWDDQMGEVMGEAMSAPFDLVLGRKTYDIFAAYWPHATEEAGGKPLNDATKYVASREPSQAGVEQLGPDRGRRGRGHRGAQEEDGPELQVHGSGNLIQTLMRHNLVDEYRLWVFPRRHRLGQAPVRGRHHPRRAEARRQHGLHHRCRDRYLRAGGRDRHGVVRAGVTA